MGFVPKRYERGRVAWVGRVCRVVPLGEYEQEFGKRKDAIYALSKNAYGEDQLVPLRNDYHADERSRRRDISGVNALIFDPFWYWGGLGVPAPDRIADLAYYYVGQTTKNSSPARIDELRQWPESKATPGIHGKSRHAVEEDSSAILATDSAKAQSSRRWTGHCR